MFMLIVIFVCSFISSSSGRVSELTAITCDNCIPIKNCPVAITLIGIRTPEVIVKLRKSFCGFSDGTPQVCCSSLETAELTVRTPYEGSLDTHPNLSLLSKTCGFIDGDRIVGGRQAGLYQFPWLTLISYKSRYGLRFKCGGSLINDRYVLTAAHCIKDQNIAGVRIGEHDIRTETDCQGEAPKIICENKLQDIKVEEEIIHPEYIKLPNNLKNDIGLLRLKKPVDFSSKNAAAICLPVTSELRDRDIQGANATVAGWGYTEHGTSSPLLLYTTVPVHSKENCRNLYNRGQTQGNLDTTIDKFCAGEPGRDSCGGDSGGPIMITGNHNGVMRLIQYGIVSYGPKQCGSSFPGVYTDVTKFMKWILDTIRI